MFLFVWLEYLVREASESLGGLLSAFRYWWPRAHFVRAFIRGKSAKKNPIRCRKRREKRSPVRRRNGWRGFWIRCPKRKRRAARPAGRRIQSDCEQAYSLIRPHLHQRRLRHVRQLNLPIANLPVTQLLHHFQHFRPG